MFQCTLLIIAIVFFIDIGLSILNYKHRHAPIPENVADVYDQKDYAKWLNYTMEVFKLSIFRKLVDTGALLVFLLAGIFPKLAAFAAPYTDNRILQSLIFLGLYYVIAYLLNIGFSIYRTFSIEERYGFNKSTVKLFVVDQIKSLLLTAILGGGLLYALLALYQHFGNAALLYGWLLITAISLIINLLYTKVFIRLFNKLTPLTEGELYDGVNALAEKTGYAVKKISVMDASKRSSRLNAFFSGFGRFKHIILYDTLIEKCTTEEVLAVLAHEIGHAKHKDVLKNFLSSSVQLGVSLGILLIFLSSEAFAAAFGFSGVHYGFAMILFSILMEPVGMVAGIPLTALSRKAEYRADAFSATVGYNNAMVDALKVLARENFSNLTPHPWMVKMTYSHPPISDRISALDKNA
ncbi:MAG: M48 family metallopeptidase [Clostridia bacterium]|nr:M48 family metallopeptidase [Clostridia bacterium]